MLLIPTCNRDRATGRTACCPLACRRLPGSIWAGLKHTVGLNREDALVVANHGFDVIVASTLNAATGTGAGVRSGDILTTAFARIALCAAFRRCFHIDMTLGVARELVRFHAGVR